MTHLDSQLSSSQSRDIWQPSDRQRVLYHKPELFSLGSVEQIQSYYTGHYYDGPNSWYWYD
jgi:hypothetical protein